MNLNESAHISVSISSERPYAEVELQGLPIQLRLALAYIFRNMREAEVLDESTLISAWRASYSIQSPSDSE